MNKKYFEYRGVSNAVYAEVLVDTAETFSTGTVKDFTGVSEIGKSTDSSNETHYYDNLPAIVIDSVGSDEISINASGIPLDVQADISGQYYDAATGMLVEQEGTPKYFAFGYITEKTDGSKVLVWRLKGKFSIPGVTAATKDDGTDANGQELTYTGISTVHKFTANGKPARAINIDTSVNQLMSESAFFASVQTPDTIATASTTNYTLTFSVGSGTAIDPIDYRSGSEVILPIPEYTGHVFQGWYLTNDYSGDQVTSVVMTANKTVYAKWGDAS